MCTWRFMGTYNPNYKSTYNLLRGLRRLRGLIPIAYLEDLRDLWGLIPTVIIGGIRTLNHQVAVARLWPNIFRVASAPIGS